MGVTLLMDLDGGAAVRGRSEAAFLPEGGFVTVPWPIFWF